jgi:pyrroline-5-carboxylate reductase
MSTYTIGFIGAGNMATSLIAGLIADGQDPLRITASDPDKDKLSQLAARFGVAVAEDNQNAVLEADVVLLAVKPQVLEQVARGLASAIQRRRPLVVSIAAGVREADLDGWLGGGVALVRSMPNTPAMVQSGATVLHATARVSAQQKDLAESILRAVGVTQWVENEQLLDAVTALSGSGPAYFFLVMEALEEAGKELGLKPETAHLLTLQTALGAARMAMESRDSPATLRHRVTSPGGTTERAVEVLETGGLRDLFRQALNAARDRSVELSSLLGERRA